MPSKPNSNNQRYRIALAHAKLDRVSSGELSIDDVHEAVISTSSTIKGKKSGLIQRYVSLIPPYDHEAGKKRYEEEIEAATNMAAELMIDRDVTSLPMTDRGVDDLEGVAAEIRDEVFEARLQAGYELSYGQICRGMYGAAQFLEILVDNKQQALAT